MIIGRICVRATKGKLRIARVAWFPDLISGGLRCHPPMLPFGGYCREYPCARSGWPPVALLLGILELLAFPAAHALEFSAIAFDPPYVRAGE